MFKIENFKIFRKVFLGYPEAKKIVFFSKFETCLFLYFNGQRQALQLVYNIYHMEIVNLCIKPMEPSNEKLKGTVDVILSEMIHNDNLVYSPFTVDQSSLIFK